MNGMISAAFSRTGAVIVALVILCGFGYSSLSMWLGPWQNKLLLPRPWSFPISLNQ